MLKIENLQVNYGGIQALRGISLEVPDGKIVTLIGANGAGKSTTLNTISGLLHSRTGSVSFLGENIHKVPPHKMVEKGLALVPEGRRVFLQMTVQENLEMGAYTQPKGGIAADLQIGIVHGIGHIGGNRILLRGEEIAVVIHILLQLLELQEQFRQALEPVVPALPSINTFAISSSSCPEVIGLHKNAPSMYIIHIFSEKSIVSVKFVYIRTI